jgi:hypothetical protein
MNERIRQLAEQAETKEVGYYYFDREKFAELIVRDCIDIISPYTVRMSRPGEEYLHPILEIKKRFGVAEREQ